MIIDPQGQVTFPDLPTGSPLGIGLGVPFEAVELALTEGSLLALYTDGLIETRGQDIEGGMHRLGTALAQPALSLEELCTRAVASPSRIRTHSTTPVCSWYAPGRSARPRSPPGPCPVTTPPSAAPGTWPLVSWTNGVWKDSWTA
ncbi:SpoIIE family protein phosphatase [Streptomyces sp. NPDC046900]|uniref:SpoIIE family protein phosphatase n=1 Tax=Streptomyces sp. NPDC046900 TaxID=3155473 RepID=UPI0033CB8D94